jgi:hypothetical protein
LLDAGGLGGGVIIFNCNSSFTQSSGTLISANGGTGNSGAGGGSGGSVTIFAQTFSGGIVQALGGASLGGGGGGAGGRIAIRVSVTVMGCECSTYGGDGEGAGGPGTIYTVSELGSTLLVDNNYLDAGEIIITDMRTTSGSVAWLTSEDYAPSLVFTSISLIGNAMLAVNFSTVSHSSFSPPPVFFFFFFFLFC